MQLDLESGTICRQTSDSRTCHTAVSDNRWRRFHFDSETKAQSEPFHPALFNCALEILLLTYLQYEWMHNDNDITQMMETRNSIENKKTFFLIAKMKNTNNDLQWWHTRTIWLVKSRTSNCSWVNKLHMFASSNCAPSRTSKLHFTKYWLLTTIARPQQRCSIE